MFNNFIYALAPMAGVTDYAFRYLCSILGADMTTTEMISANALTYKSKLTERMLIEKESSSIKCVQLFGHDEIALKNVLNTTLLDKFDVIDFNCGCPAPKVVKNFDGSALMGDIDKARSLIRTIVSNTTKPVSVKFRLGINNLNNFLEFGRMCEEEGVSFVTLHARTREQQYSGEVLVSAYKDLCFNLSIPVIWSGDIKTKEDVDIAKSVGCSGVMIGRATYGNPLIFYELKGVNVFEDLNILKNLSEKLNFDFNNFKTQVDNLSYDEKKKFLKKYVIKKHFELIKLNFINSDAICDYFKKHLAWYMTGETGVSELRRKIFSFSKLEEIENFINNL